MDDQPPRIVDLFLWCFFGGVIGVLLSSLGDYQFQQHVNVFYPTGSPHSTVMQSVACVGELFCPFAWAGTLWGGLYPCRRSRLWWRTVSFYGFMGYGVGLLTSGYVVADPGPNFMTYAYNISGGCLAGTLLGFASAAIAQRRLSLDETPARPEHVSSRSAT